MLNGRANDIKKHKWFEGLDWEALEARKVAPLRKPKEDSAKRLKELTVSSRAADMLSTLARLPEFQVPSSIINKSQYFKRFPAHDELGTWTSLVCPEQPFLCIPIRPTSTTILILA